MVDSLRLVLVGEIRIGMGGVKVAVQEVDYILEFLFSFDEVALLQHVQETFEPNSLINLVEVLGCALGAVLEEYLLKALELADLLILL